MLRRFAVALLALAACRGVGDQPAPAARGGAVAPTEPKPIVEPPPPAPALATPTSFAPVQACVPPQRPAPWEVSTAWNVTYVMHEHRPVQLDVASPKSPGIHPLVVLVHGGAWVGGDRLYHRDDVLKLAGAGYVAATIDYRLAHGPGEPLRAQLADVRCAVRYLRVHADEYGIDQQHVAAIGDSAGGHLVALLAAADDLPDDGSCPYSAVSARIDAAVLDYAPLDLRAWRRYPPSIREAVHALIGVDPALDPTRAAAASPITHVDAGDPPMLVLHATHDHVIPVEDSREFAEALRAAHVPSLYVEVPDPLVQHGFLVLGSGAILRRSTCSTMAFLAATLGGPP